METQTTQQKIKQFRNVAVALVRDEDGNVLLTRPSDSINSTAKEDWTFPTHDIVPGATYNETFVSEIHENTGCIIEAVSLVASEKYLGKGLLLEYVECKVVCRERVTTTSVASSSHRWVHPSKIKTYYKKKIHSDILDFLGL